jgi:hypothetical protein
MPRNMNKPPNEVRPTPISVNGNESARKNRREQLKMRRIQVNTGGLAVARVIAQLWD